MRKTTAKYSGSIFLWLLMVSPVALVLAIEKKHPDFENYVESGNRCGPLWNLAMWMSGHSLLVIWAGAALVVEEDGDRVPDSARDDGSGFHCGGLGRGCEV